jgi:hypothetical protein
VAAFVDQDAEHVDPFDTPDLLDTGGCRFHRLDG